MIEILELRDIIKTANVGPGLCSMTWSYILLAYEKNMADEEKFLYTFEFSKNSL